MKIAPDVNHMTQPNPIHPRIESLSDEEFDYEEAISVQDTDMDCITTIIVYFMALTLGILVVVHASLFFSKDVESSSLNESLVWLTFFVGCLLAIAVIATSSRPNKINNFALACPIGEIVAIKIKKIDNDLLIFEIDQGEPLRGHERRLTI